MSIESPVLSVVIDEFQKTKKLADQAIAQLSDAQLKRYVDLNVGMLACATRGRFPRRCVTRAPRRRST